MVRSVILQHLTLEFKNFFHCIGLSISPPLSLSLSLSLSHTKNPKHKHNQTGDYIEHIKAEVMADLNKVENLLQKSGRGVFVQASTLGSLEALLTFLRELDPPIPVSGYGLGTLCSSSKCENISIITRISLLLHEKII